MHHPKHIDRLITFTSQQFYCEQIYLVKNVLDSQSHVLSDLGQCKLLCQLWNTVF